MMINSIRREQTHKDVVSAEQIHKGVVGLEKTCEVFEYKTILAQLRLSQNIFENTSEAILITNADRLVTVVNDEDALSSSGLRSEYLELEITESMVQTH